MNAERLLQRFERISEAPNAVPRLRRLILDLAVRGELVEHDPADEPARELFNRITMEKQRLVAANTGKNHMPLPLICSAEKTFPISSGWTWARIGDLAICTDYGTSEKSSANMTDGVPVLTMGDIRDGRVDLGRVKKMVPKEIDGLPALFLRKFDLLYNRTNSPELVGKTGIFLGEDNEYTFASYIIRIRLAQGFMNPHFLNLAMNSPWFRETQIAPRVKKQTGQANVNGTAMTNMVIPLPPIAEQHRIVAKVDELMALCDDMEAAQVKREERRDRLVAATLLGLSSGGATPAGDGCPTLKEGARFFFSHLPRLILRPENIEQLRQTILDLAIQGRLLPQDVRDEPASALLARINSRKVQAPTATITDAIAGKGSNQIPVGWESVDLAQILLTLQTGPFGSSLPQQEYELGGVPVINPASIKNEAIVPIADMAVGERTLKRLASFRMQAGDVVMGRRGELGRCAVVTEVEAGWLCGTGSLLLRFTEDISPRFIVKMMAAPSSRNFLGQASVGSTMQNLNQSILRRMPVLLPPLAEQQRIVAKIDELMVLCDELEARLTETASTRDQLLEALIHEVLVG